MSTDFKSVKTYDEGGKGKKQCSECKKFVGAVTKICACGFDFKNQVKPEKITEIKTYDEGGKGKKQCSECKKFVGALTKVCACGFEFFKAKKENKPTTDYVKKEPIEKVHRPSINPLMLGCRYSITAPAGKCPHKLDSTNPEDIDAWANKVRNSFSNESKFLTLSGLIYFVRHFYEMFSPEYQMVKDHLETSLGHERSYGLG